MPGDVQCSGDDLATCDSSGSWKVSVCNTGDPEPPPLGVNQHRTCENAVCGVACDEGFQDCDGSRTLGCEADTSRSCEAVDCSFRGSRLSIEEDLLVFEEPQGNVPVAITSDAANVYWSRPNDGDAGTYTLRRAPNTGGAAVDISVRSQEVSELASDGETLYWAEDGDVLSMPIAGGETTVISSGHPAGAPSNLQYADGRLVWLRSVVINIHDVAANETTTVVSGHWPNTVWAENITIFGSNLLWSRIVPNNDGQIVRMPLAGGEQTVVVANQLNPQPLATDGIDLFWLGRGSELSPILTDHLRRADAGGEGTITSTTIEDDLDLGAENFMATNGHCVIYRTGSALRAQPVHGGAVKLIGGAIDQEMRSQDLYWVRTDGHIYRTDFNHAEPF